MDPVLQALIQSQKVLIRAQMATASLSYEPAFPRDRILLLIDMKSAAKRPASVLFVASTVKR
jgi:hypothetical protein